MTYSNCHQRDNRQKKAHDNHQLTNSPNFKQTHALEMTSRIPTSTSVNESAVIAAPLAKVWHLIKLQDFHQFWSKLEKSDYVKGASPETDVVKWTFKDGTVLNVKQEEHSVYPLHTTYSNLAITGSLQSVPQLPLFIYLHPEYFHLFFQIIRLTQLQSSQSTTT